jgi:hypothetical protein
MRTAEKTRNETAMLWFITPVFHFTGWALRQVIRNQYKPTGG